MLNKSVARKKSAKRRQCSEELKSKMAPCLFERIAKKEIRECIRYYKYEE